MITTGQGRALRRVDAARPAQPHAGDATLFRQRHARRTGLTARTPNGGLAVARLHRPRPEL